MKFTLITILSFFSIHFTYSQVTNTKEAIVKNKVKSSTERYCFTNSSESCTTVYQAYDKRGNTVEWDMQRLGTKYEYVYDSKNRKIAKFWINKSATTKIDTTEYIYDTYNQIISKKTPEYNKVYKNSYDEKNRLVKRIYTFTNQDKDSTAEIEIYTWTSFNKIKSEYFFTLKKGQEKDTLHSTFNSFEYDIYENLTRKIHYKDNKIINTICYDYDTSLRLSEQKEYDDESIEFWNSEYAEYKDRIEYYVTKITYDSKGRIEEKYTYFNDPCMSLDDHFTFKHFYKKNDLLQKIEVIAKDKIMFTISFTYTFY